MTTVVFYRFLFAIIFSVVAVPTSVFANIGVDWIVSQSQLNGAYQNAATLARDEQSTSEALRAFKSLDLPLQPGQTSAQTFIADQTLGNTETLVRKIIVKVEAAQPEASLVEQLLARQSVLDGGFAEFSDYDSSSLDTAWALEALALANRKSSEASSYAVGYLLAQQRADGSWLQSDAGSPLYVTAVAAASLAHYRYIYDVDAAINLASNYLLSAVSANGAVGDVFETALALLAVRVITGDATVYQSLRDYLTSSGPLD